MGFRFRLHRKDLPGKPDLVFPRLHKVIFVHGCFWHQHSGCREGRVPASRKEYWGPKLERNQERDQENLTRLHSLGWDACVIWECETAGGANLKQLLERFLGKSKKKGLGF
jgi:DNA mismatch endonuclease (patch repair protein)